ncbi:MAG: putative secreted protein [Marmoricola sp.]|nr:putative secreted protein [Marmoricola sp.]
MNRTILAAPALCLAAALALTGCGSAGTTASLPATTPTTAAPAAADPAATSAELLAAINGLIDPAKTPAEHVAEVEAGSDLGPTFKKLATYIAEGPAVTFKVKNPAVTGDTAKADVEISSGGSALEELYPAFFQQVDGRWKVTRTGFCSLVAVSGITCPDLAG